MTVSSNRDDQLNGRVKALIAGSPFLDPVVAEVGDEHRTVISYCDRNCVIKLAGGLSHCAEARQELTVGGEFLDPVIVEVGDEYVARLVDSHARYGSKPTVERPEYIDRERSAPFASEISVSVEHLNAVVVAVRRVQRTVGAQRYIGRIVELARPNADFSSGSPLPRETAVGFELLHALIVEVRDKQIAIRCHRQATGRIKLAGATARLADDAFGRAVEGEDLNSVVEIFGHI